MSRFPAIAATGGVFVLAVVAAWAGSPEPTPGGPGRADGLPPGEVRCFEGHGPGGMRRVALSPDGRFALSSGHDQTVRLWDVDAGKQVCRLGDAKESVWALAFSPDGRHAVTTGGPWVASAGLIRVWDARTGRELDPVREASGPVTSLAYSPDGKRLLVAGVTVPSAPGGRGSAYVSLLDVETGKELRSFTTPERSIEVAFASGGRRAVTLEEQSVVRRWDLDSGKELNNFRRLPGGTYAPSAVSADGRRVLAGSGLWDVRHGKEVSQIDAKSFQEPGQPEGDWLAPERHAYIVTSVALSPDGRRTLVGVEHSLRTRIKVPAPTPRPGERMYVSDPIVESRTIECTLRLWDGEARKELHCFRGLPSRIECIAFSADGRRAITGSLDGKVRVWQLPE